NRVRYTKMGQLHDAADPLLHRRPVLTSGDMAMLVPPRFASMKTLGDRVSQFALTRGNRITPLNGGDYAYPAMLEAINAARHSVALCSYIFDSDPVGEQFVQALVAAQERGVEVRVLVDAIGARYSRPPITHLLHDKKIRTGLFMRNSLGLRLSYANMRSHRKLLIVDGRVGFTGGMNIRAGFTSQYTDDQPAGDVHFRAEGPLVPQLMTVFAHDWEFTTREALHGDLWFPTDANDEFNDGVPARAVACCP